MQTSTAYRSGGTFSDKHDFYLNFRLVLVMSILSSTRGAAPRLSVYQTETSWQLFDRWR